MRHWPSLATCIFLVLFGSTGDAQSPSSSDRTRFKAEPPAFADANRRAVLARAFPDVDAAMRAFVAREHVPGAAWGIVVDGELAHLGVTGLRDVARQSPVDADTVFRIASMTKSFTAMAILALRDEGKLALDDPAERYIPELAQLVYPTSDAPRITIRHLLSHATGFPEDNPWGDQQLADTDDQLTAMIRAGIPFSNPPGVAYEYSNYGFALLGRVVTRVAGMPYREYVKARVLTPLGMSSTTLEPADVPAQRLAHGYRWEDEQWKEEAQLPDGAFGSMGGMLTSIRDLSRYVSAYLDAWPPRDGPESLPVRRSSLREMQQVSRPRAAAVTRDASGSIQLSSGGYGFGLGIAQTCQFGLSVAHSGGLPGFGSLMRWLPEYGVGLVVFGNRTYTGWGAVAEESLQLLARTGALQPRVVRPSPALVTARDTVSRLVTAWDDDAIERIAAVNLFMDRSKARRRAELDTFRSQLGACRADDTFDYVENPLRGEWLLRCDGGTLRASVTLAPTAPPTVQFLEVRPVAADEPPRHRTCP
ncbi:MAG: serine hydrolase domain-containing protein [Vicinamibacterales bacterium]